MQNVDERTVLQVAILHRTKNPPPPFGGSLQYDRSSLLGENPDCGEALRVLSPNREGKPTRFVIWELFGLEHLPRDEPEVRDRVKRDLSTDQSSSSSLDQFLARNVQCLFRTQ